MDHVANVDPVVNGAELHPNSSIVIDCYDLVRCILSDLQLGRTSGLIVGIIICCAVIDIHVFVLFQSAIVGGWQSNSD